MTVFTVEFEVDNEAFHARDETIIDEDEVANMLDKVAATVRMGSLEGGVMDVNGNKIGHFGIVP